MKKTYGILAVILCLCVAVSLFAACSKPAQSTPVDPADFRVTAYMVGDRFLDKDSIDYSHFYQVTDFILFGVATFDEEGNITLSDIFNTALENIRANIKTDGSQRLYLNLLGPGNQSDSSDWYDQMADQAQRHNNAFESGNLENNIKSVLTEYGFDGVFFDYEFPIKSKYWKVYNKFIVSLDEVLGDDFRIGVTLVDWDAKQSKAAMAATDLVELMSYDNWDKDRYHSTLELAKHDVETLVKKGYDKSKIDLGVPFYARPTTGEAYWYEYKSYYNGLDGNGLYEDIGNTNLIFSFNDYDLIKAKTDYALEEGLGGIMMWHYTCDTPANNERSLFNAIEESINEAKAAK